MEKAKNGIQLIAEERERQIKIGYDERHDSQHSEDILVDAAMSYVSLALIGIKAKDLSVDEAMYFKFKYLEQFPSGWEFKPSTNNIRDLVKAGALIAAAIDRINSKLTVDNS